MSAKEICAATTDCKITDSELIKDLGLWAHLGRPDGHHYIPDEKATQKYKGVKESPGTGWLKLYASKSDPTGLQDFSKGQNPKKTSKILWTCKAENSIKSTASSSVLSDETLISTSLNKVVTMSSKTGNKKWEKELDENIIGTAFGKSMIFTGTEEGIYALDEETGNVKWEQLVGDVTSDPIVFDDEVIAGCSDGYVYSFNIENGQVEWSYDFNGPAYVSKGQSNNVYVGANNIHYAFDLKDKDLLWKYETNGVITKKSVEDKNTVFFGSWDGNLYAINEKTGELSWKYSTGWGIDTSPAIKNGIVYVGSNDNNFYAIDEDSGELVWFYTCKAGIHSSPVVYGDLVFFGSDDGRMYALDKTNGDLIWNFAPEYTIKDNDINNFITTPILSDPVVEDGVVYIDVKGTIYALDAQTYEDILILRTPGKNGISPVMFVLILLALISIAILAGLYIKNKKKTF